MNARTATLTSGPPETWERFAACGPEDIELFFGPVGPEDRSDRAEREERAKQVCARCPVVDPCRTSALSRGERFGVWGGLGERERRSLTRAVG